MEYKQHTLEQLQKMFEKEQNLEESNKNMSAISNKHDVLFDDNEGLIMSNWKKKYISRWTSSS